jgi:hypothetical protein
MRILKSIGLALAALLLVSTAVSAATPKDLLESVKTQMDAVNTAGAVLTTDPSMENVQVVVDASMEVLTVLSQQTPDVCAIPFFIALFDFNLNNIVVGTALINGANKAVTDFLIGRISPISEQMALGLDDCDGVGSPDAA